jgi:hypothetical protein
MVLPVVTRMVMSVIVHAQQTLGKGGVERLLEGSLAMVEVAEMTSTLDPPGGLGGG